MLLTNMARRRNDSFNVSFQYFSRKMLPFSIFLNYSANENPESFTNNLTCCNIATPGFLRTWENVSAGENFSGNFQLIIYCQAKS